MILDRVVASNDCAAMSGAADDKPGRALLQTWGTAARRHPVGGLGSIGEMLIEHNHGFGQGRGSNSECSFNQAHLRSEEHTSELQSLMRISYAVFCLKKKKKRRTSKTKTSRSKLTTKK